MNIALLGLGRAGQFHLQSIRQGSRLNLRHAMDVDGKVAEAVGREFGCASGTKAEAALADPEVDAVIVATPTETHFEYIQAALKAGKAVFTEKPLGIRLEEIDGCYGLAAEKGLPLFVGFMRRFDPSFADLAQRVRAGEVGRLQILRTTSRDSPLPTIDYIKTSHGIFHDCIVHDLDMIRFIAGEDPEEVFTFGSNFIEAIRDVNDLDTVMVSLKFPSGLLSTTDISRKSVYGYDQRIEVFGSEGMLQAENRAPTSTVSSTLSGVRRPSIEHSFPSRYREAYQRELETFRDCLAAGKPMPITHEDARKNFILANAAERSFREGKPLKIDYGGVG